jgi:signal transduction histidine kinase
MAQNGYQRTKLLMLGTFGVIATLLGMLQGVNYLEGRETRRSIELVQEDALVSIRLVGRMGMDVQSERILIDRHIFERAPRTMAATELRIKAVRNDYAEAARTYSQLETFAGEAFAAQQLSADVASEQRAVEAALAMSRDNRDLEATEELVALDPLFDKIDDDATALIVINEQAAERAVATVKRLQGRNLGVRLAATAAILVTVLVGGAWVTRLILDVQRQLTDANHELAAKNRELDAFAERVAHDLRGPLNTVTLSTSILAEELPAASAASATIDRSVTQIANLIDDLLLLSRIGSLSNTMARIEPIAVTLKEDLRQLVGEAAGSVRVELEPSEVVCSQGLLRQVLWNLAENAFKYRRRDLPVEIQIVGRKERDRYTIRVTDNGQGMSDADTKHVFEPFFRSRRTSAISGTGLGLAIVKRIVEASGGSVAVKSTLDGGTTFTITLRTVHAA